ncbi:MAG: heavy metal translocating P-type ATPase [Gemmatimonadales bacterium]
MLPDLRIGSEGVMAAGTDTRLEELQLRVGEMDCPSCLAKIERRLKTVDGIEVVQGSVVHRTLTITLDRSRVTDARVQEEIGRVGYVAQAILPDAPAPPRARTWESRSARRVFAAIGIVALAAISGLVARDVLLISAAAYPVTLADAWLVVAALVAGWSFFPKGWLAARRLSLDMNFLMTIAIFGAVALGDFVEAASIAILFGIAELLEAYSVDRARASIESLMHMAPDTAVVIRRGMEVSVPASALAPGDVIVVRPGDRIAADGTVLEGSSAVDQSAITGESLPVEKAPDATVFSGTVNREGHLRVRVDRPASESALAKIVRMVEQAEREKTRSERFAERFARHYTPAVAVAAVFITLVPPLLLDGTWSVWITRGLTLLVIACPCALVISTPVAVVSGITAAARHGVLIKGGTYLEALASIRVFAFDKTGTLTLGHPTVESVVMIEGDERDALARAAAVERRSEHPLARAIVEAAEERRAPAAELRVTDFQAIPGKGARAKIDGEVHVVGSPSLFPGAVVPNELQDAGHSLVGIARGDTLLAWFSLADQPRAAAASALRELKQLGIERTIMITGDNPATAASIGSRVGVDEVRAGLLPGDKVAVVKELERRYGPVAAIGDGVNDGPVLAAATVGVAMGAAGSDTALEVADAALMGDDLEKLPYVVRLSRRARAVIRENIVAAIAIKIVLAIGVPLGYVSLITAVLVGDLGVSLAVTANALRLGRVNG